MSGIILFALLVISILCPFTISSTVLDFNELERNTTAGTRVKFPQVRTPNRYEHPYWENFGIFDDSTCFIDKKIKKEIKGYQEIVDGIMMQAISGRFKGETFKHLAHFTDSFGSRLVTSPQYSKAAGFLSRQLLNIPTLNGRVFIEDVELPDWKRYVLN